MEESLTNQEDNETKVAQQIASDQEVIAFLDTRVQELEKQVSDLHAHQAEVDAERDKLRDNLEQRTTVLQDMLQFERERFVEFEKDAKSTKKVLVKEIKLCRNQITALTAERDALKEQNQTLQSAVMHTSSSGMGDRVYA
jgi:chromosome segregation ATPase